jgi:2,4-dienoyl-CoA reductase-like NADH-dependent reductase (Old Yellow Enzyme family)
VQLAHAGRKASTLAPWHPVVRGRGVVAAEEMGGWLGDVVAPSAVPFAEGYPVPREMTLGEIAEVVEYFKSAARRAVEAGVDTMEVHGAHGYLVNEFMSPLSNVSGGLS